jgi:hypothetical protein
MADAAAAGELECVVRLEVAEIEWIATLQAQTQ